MKNLGIWSGPVIESREPIYAEDKDAIKIITSKVAGMFIREVECGARVEKGQLLGRVINPLEGVVKEEILASDSGLLFTIREYPVVEVGSLIGRIFK